MTVAAAAGPVRTLPTCWRLRRRRPGRAGLVLVPHSNAGLYVAALAAVRRWSGWSSWTPGSRRGADRPPSPRPALREHLGGAGRRRRAAAAVDAVVAGRRPSTRCSRTPDSRAAVEPSSAGCRWPTSDADGAHAAGLGARCRRRYLAFGDTYAEERARPRRAGLAGRDAAGGAPAPAGRPGGVLPARRRTPWTAARGPGCGRD